MPCLYRIPFNRPYLVGKELEYIRQAYEAGHVSGNGFYTKSVQAWFAKFYGFRHNLPTQSCTDALEMSALLAGIGPGDEVIAPSFTFVSSVNPFVMRGAKVVFADSQPDHPNMDTSQLESLVTPRTRAVVAVHYGGIACAPDQLVDLARRHRLHLIEDAAQAIDATYKGRPLGSFGSLSAFSFHETKNIHCGEGGLLVVNDIALRDRAEIIWEKGTNRAAFYRGEVDKYGWVDVGSSFLPSEITAAALMAQLESLRIIQDKRLELWSRYHEQLRQLYHDRRIGIPNVPADCGHNAHLFYVACQSLQERTDLQRELRDQGMESVFHYQALHRSEFYRSQHDGRKLKHADRFTDCLLRLPLFYGLPHAHVDEVCAAIRRFYSRR
jgi:dTDP-4-amino-4,6-dideoxygalactose transaminase